MTTSTKSEGEAPASIGQRLRKLAGELVAEAFVADIHDHDRGVRELEKLTYKFEDEILHFMLAEERRKSHAMTQDDESSIKILIEKLRDASLPDQNGCRLFTADLARKAAFALTVFQSHITTLEAERDKLAEALRPFVGLLALAQNGAVMNGQVTVLKQTIPAVWIDDARAALATSSPNAMREAAAPESGQEGRCKICGWPLSDTPDKGCVPGNCSYRPEQFSDEWQRIQARRTGVLTAIKE